MSVFSNLHLQKSEFPVNSLCFMFCIQRLILTHFVLYIIIAVLWPFLIAVLSPLFSLGVDLVTCSLIGLFFLIEISCVSLQ